MLDNFQVVGHRGFRSQYPENTLVSFQAAVKFGVDAIEFDVHPTKDRQLVITHDHTVERCSNGTGAVHDFTFEEIRKLDFGGWKDPKFTNTQIPTLEETFDAVLSLDPNFYLLIELKEDDDECTRQVYDLCQKYGVLSHGLILSFHNKQLELLRQWNPDILLQGFPERYIKKPITIDGIYNKICYWTADANSDEIAACHDKNITVDIYPVDTEEQFAKALTLDVDSITTNSPDVIYPLLRQHHLR